MNKLKSNIILSFITFNLLNFSCFPWGIRNDVESYAQLFIDVHDLGRRITLHSSFNEFLGHIPDRKWESRVYLSRIDDLPIGRGYGDLDKWDMALETGFIDGLIRKGLIIAEKLDHVSPRNKSEFIGLSLLNQLFGQECSRL